MRARALALVVTLALAGWSLRGSAKPSAAPPPALVVPKLAVVLPGTKCSACHVETGWSEIRFNHDKTGFPLEGGHVSITCRGCHRQDFRAPISDTCSGCHRDRHAGEFGMHCEGCHDARSWRATLFSGDGHRSTAFPLVGKHAVIPCTECHGNMRDRSFIGAPLACVGCHRADYVGAATKSIDHVAAGFNTDCQSCHNTFSFFPARFDAHDQCFKISSGPHRGFHCENCHSTISGLMLTGTCATAPFMCTSCHSHTCAISDQQHPNVMGYTCQDQKCFECHQR